VVIPEQDAVVAVTSQTWVRHGAIKLILETLLPALTGTALPANPTDAAALKNELNRLVIPASKGSKASALSAQYHRKLFILETNSFAIREARFLFKDNACGVEWLTAEGAVSFEFGWEAWHLNKGMPKNLFNVADLNPANIQYPSKIARTATWLAPNTLQLRVKYVEVIHHDTLTCVFEGDKVSISFLNSIVENTKRATETRKPLKGTLKKPSN